MAQFFRAPAKHDLTIRTREHAEYKRLLNNLFNQFSKEHSIQAESWYPRKFELRVVATTEDRKQFKEQLKVDGETFKKSSVIHKAWVESTKDIWYKEKPFLPFEFMSRSGKDSDRSRWNGFFSKAGNYYTFVESTGEFDPPDGVIEIKGSEYYLVKEKLED